MGCCVGAGLPDLWVRREALPQEPVRVLPRAAQRSFRVVPKPQCAANGSVWSSAATLLTTRKVRYRTYRTPEASTYLTMALQRATPARQ
jgi:hypothetical protein